MGAIPRWAEFLGGQGQSVGEILASFMRKPKFVGDVLQAARDGSGAPDPGVPYDAWANASLLRGFLGGQPATGFLGTGSRGAALAAATLVAGLGLQAPLGVLPWDSMEARAGVANGRASLDLRTLGRFEAGQVMPEAYLGGLDRTGMLELVDREPGEYTLGGKRYSVEHGRATVYDSKGNPYTGDRWVYVQDPTTGAWTQVGGRGGWGTEPAPEDIRTYSKSFGENGWNRVAFLGPQGDMVSINGTAGQAPVRVRVYGTASQPDPFAAPTVAPVGAPSGAPAVTPDVLGPPGPPVPSSLGGAPMTDMVGGSGDGPGGFGELPVEGSAIL